MTSNRAYTLLALILIVLAAGACVVAFAQPPVTAAIRPVGSPIDDWTVTPAPTSSRTPTPTICPMPTPEALWVDPVISPTELLTQTVRIYIGRGEAVTVTTQSGVFTATGSFDAYGHPALVDIDLLPATRHDLLVKARVQQSYQGGCPYGGYTLSTLHDRNGKPLVIEQVPIGRVSYLPVILR